MQLGDGLVIRRVHQGSGATAAVLMYPEPRFMLNGKALLKITALSRVPRLLQSLLHISTHYTSLQSVLRSVFTRLTNKKSCKARLCLS